MVVEKNVFITFEVFTAVTMNTGVFWDVTPCGLEEFPKVDELVLDLCP
jgi:hypothetical protein